MLVTAPGYMQASVDPVTVKPISQDGYKDLVVRLRPASSFEGTVVEAGSGKPAEGVFVTAWDTSSCRRQHKFFLGHEPHQPQERFYPHGSGRQVPL